ncbi:MAG: hypothetical protein ACFFAJ_02925 [Candidatus Hodarchaeota archaeon]
MDNKPNEGSSISEGLIITILQDDGPVNVYDSSPLSESEAYNMAIKTMTAIGSDVRGGMELGEIRAFGPMPTGRDPYLTLAFIFFLRTKTTIDERIARYGRLIVFWIITTSTATMRYIGLIKQTIRRTLQMYHIETAEDLQNKDIMPKIEEKLQIIESGIESFYITEDDQIDSFVDLSLIPSFYPIIFVDNPSKMIKILLRKETPPTRKTEILNLVRNEFKNKFPKISLYKIEIISDPLFIQGILSKAGFTQEPSPGVPFQIRLSDQLTYEKLDFLIDNVLFLRKNQLIKVLLTAIEEQRMVNIDELSIETGLSSELIIEAIERAKKDGLLLNSEIKDGNLVFKK